MKTRRIVDLAVRSLVIGGAVAGMMLVASHLSGCATGHGKYTKEHASGAKVKMDALKAGSEYQMSQQALLAGDLPKAQKHIDYAIQLNPKVARFWVLKGRTALEQGSMETAAGSLAKAEELEPENPEAAYYGGILAERIGRTQDAVERYQTAAKRDPSSSQYVLAAAESLIQLDRLDDAESYVNDHAARFDHTAGIRQILGHIAVLRNDHEKALRLFKEARLLAPDDLAIQEDLARTQMTLGKYGDAETNLARLVRAPEYSKRRDLQHLRAQCLLSLDRLVPARDAYIQLTSGDDGANDVDAWVGLGQTAYTLRDVLRLRDASQRVLSLAPERPEGYLLRGLYFRRVEDYRSAREQLEKAASINPCNSTITLLGMTMQDLGENEYARQCFQTVLSRDPSDKTASALLATLGKPGATDAQVKGD